MSSRGVALLEHINLNVPSRAVAHSFYVCALGGAVHPIGTRKHQLHVNLGISQVHLPFAETPADGQGERCEDLGPLGADSWREATPADGSAYVGEPQRMGDGCVCVLWVRSVDASLARLRAAEGSGALADTSFAFAAAPSEGVDEGGEGQALAFKRPGRRTTRWSTEAGANGEAVRAVRVTCPWGNQFELREAPEGVRAALEPAAIGRHPGGGGDLCLGIAELNLPLVPPCGGARKLAALYAKAFEAEVACGEGEAAIALGPHQTLRFIESGEADPRAYWTQRRVHGWHLCIYVRQWDRARERALTMGLAKPSDRFAALDAPLEPVQFRMTDLVDEQGELLLALEHEVRSLSTRMCPLLEGRESRRDDV